MEPTPDQEPPARKPPSRGSAEENSEDRRFWGLDDDLEAAPAPPEHHRPSTEAPPPGPLADDLVDDPPAAPASAADPTPAARTGALSRRDLVWIGLLGVFLLAVVFLAYQMFRSNITTVGRPDEVDFPVEGNRIVIDEITTYWRKPDRELDHVKLDAHLIPCAEIVLKSGEGAGRLRLFFQNEDGDVVGDPVALNFADGKFSSGDGSDTITINATDGFKDEGQHNAYAQRKTDFWYLAVSEGPATEDSDGEFKEIVRVRVLPTRR